MCFSARRGSSEAEKRGEGFRGLGTLASDMVMKAKMFVYRQSKYSCRVFNGNEVASGKVGVLEERARSL